MALMHTPAAVPGAAAPAFSLKATDGKVYGFNDVAGPRGTVIMFICNHCPYVKAIVGRLTGDMKALQAAGIGVAAIMPNDTTTHPADSFDNMKLFAEQNNFSFPYLIDETQEVARAYGAVCTPDFFGYDAQANLHYRGRLDAVNPSRPATPDTAHELLEAMLQLAGTGRIEGEQKPSMGCSIKWKAQAA